MMKSLALISLVILATACGQWNQDPLAGISGAQSKGQEKPTVPEAPKPIDSEALRIDSPEDFAFEQGQAGEFVISSRVFEPGYQGRLSFKNIDQFQGASFDAKTGKFRWTPPVGTVGESDGLERKMSLDVLLIAEKTGSISLQRTKNIRISVTRKPAAPQIISFTMSKTSLREGEMSTGYVVYEDKDANEKDNSTWPILQFRTSMGSAHIMSYMELGSTASQGNHRFQTAFTLNLREAEVTKTYDNFSVVVRAVSAMNETSADASVGLTIYTSLSDANTTWTQSVPFTAGTLQTYDFLFMDPKGEAKLEFNNFTNVPRGATANCSNVNPSVLSCRLMWDVPANAVTGPGMMNMKLTVKSTSSFDTFFKPQSFNLSYSVAPAPTTTTTTTVTTTTVLKQGVR